MLKADQDRKKLLEIFEIDDMNDGEILFFIADIFVT